MKVPTVFEAVTTLALAAVTVLGPGDGSQARVPDEQLTGDVMEYFLADQRLTGCTIDITAKGGVVTLSGEATHPLLKEHASRLAQHVRGVRLVVNRIEVDEHADHDEDLRRILCPGWSYRGGN
jgi:osmotically-inducible protein OsmY